MKQYHDLIKHVLETGEEQENRTGINSISVPGAMMRFDLADGFPLITTKKMATGAIFGELCAFLRASRSAADFRALGCKVWDQNANENKAWLANPFRAMEDHLGPVYGVQWREWPGYKVLPVPLLTAPDEVKARHRAMVAKMMEEGWELKGILDEGKGQEAVFYKAIDQLGDCIRTIIKDPDNRRILFHGWNPAVLDEVALPACHLLYQFLPRKKSKKMHMCLYVRSNDVGLGTPFNIAEAAALLKFVAHLTGYEAGSLSYMMADAHIYVNQLDYLNEQLTKEPLPLPTLRISDRIPEWHDLPPLVPTGDLVADAGAAAGRQAVIDLAIEHSISFLKEVTPEDFILEGYQYHELKTPRPSMAV